MTFLYHFRLDQAWSAGCGNHNIGLRHNLCQGGWFPAQRFQTGQRIERQVCAKYRISSMAHQHFAGRQASRPEANLTDHGMLDIHIGLAAGVRQCGNRHHSGAMLVVVHYRDFEPRLQPSFDLETARRRNIFELDGGKGGGDIGYRIYNFICICGTEQDGDARQAN